jgi:PAS domain-containing protein
MDLEGAWSSTADGVCAVGADGTIVLWNRAAETILGHASGDVLGRPCGEVSPVGTRRGTAGARATASGRPGRTRCPAAAPAETALPHTRPRTSRKYSISRRDPVALALHSVFATVARNRPRGPRRA